MTRRRIADEDLSRWIEAQADPSSRFLVGIAGSPGSGKSTLAARVARDLDAIVVAMDGFHLPNSVLDRRGLRDLKGSPQTFDADSFVRVVRDLRAGVADVAVPDFDRVVDEPRRDRIAVPASARVVIVEGNYLLLDSDPWSELRGLFDVVAHLDVHNDVRIARLIDRHVRFGRSRAQAVEFVEVSDEPNARLVEAVSYRAHLVVEGST